MSGPEERDNAHPHPSAPNDQHPRCPSCSLAASRKPAEAVNLFSSFKEHIYHRMRDVRSRWDGPGPGVIPGALFGFHGLREAVTMIALSFLLSWVTIYASRFLQSTPACPPPRNELPAAMFILSSLPEQKLQESKSLTSLSLLCQQLLSAHSRASRNTCQMSCGWTCLSGCCGFSHHGTH